jgi:hypothetical protein
MLADALPLADRATVPLAEVLADAPAMTRVDRKYFVSLDDAAVLLEALPDGWRTLDVAGRRTTHYRSTYFDTDRLTTARAHWQGRRRRWKARSRLYVEDRLCRIEVKVRDGRGRTVKTVADRPRDTYGHLDHASRDFVVDTLAAHHLRVDADRLRPVTEVDYERLTLARTDGQGGRLTLDWGVRAHWPEGTVALDADHVLVETKGGLRPSDADRLLVQLGRRATSFSKYAASAALVRPDLPDNDVRRLVGSLLHVIPTPTQES